MRVVAAIERVDQSGASGAATQRIGDDPPEVVIERPRAGRTRLVVQHVNATLVNRCGRITVSWGGRVGVVGR